MKLRVLLLLLGLTFIGVSNVCVAQMDDETVDPLTPGKAPPRIYVGPVVGYNRVQQTGGFASFAEARCPVFEDGSDNGYFAGISMEFLLGDPKNSKSSIIIRALYDNLPSSFTATGDNLPSLVPVNGKQTIVYTTTQHTAEIDYKTIDLELMYRFNLGNTPFGITAGLCPGFVIAKNVTQNFELIEPANAQFVPVTDGSVLRYSADYRTATIKDGAIPEANSFRFGIKAGIQYEMILKRITVIPSLNYNFGVTNVNKSDSWRVNAIQAQVDVRFAL